MKKKLPTLIYVRNENSGDAKNPDWFLNAAEHTKDFTIEVGQSYSVGVYKLVEVQRLENKTTLLKK